MLSGSLVEPLEVDKGGVVEVEFWAVADVECVSVEVDVERIEEVDGVSITVIVTVTGGSRVSVEVAISGPPIIEEIMSGKSGIETEMSAIADATL